MIIPKVIHYCWFGNHKKPKLVEDCISSWKLHMPDYQIIEWNEEITNLKHPFLKTAYRLKKWAYVSDFVRLTVLSRFGGIYLDTDMLLLKPLDNFLEDKCFFGAESKNHISAGIIGTIKNHSFINECLSKYDGIKFNNETNWEEICIPRIITLVFKEKYNYKNFFLNKTKIDDIVIYPPSYFYPLNYKSRADIKNYKDYLKTESHAVHLWNASWIEQSEFYYLRSRQYSKGLKIILNNIATHRKISYKYLRKILSSVKESI
jgi:hypothetical protein